jgi:hypothetical protein
MDLVTLCLIACYSLGCILLGIGIGIIITERKYEPQEDEVERNVIELTEVFEDVSPKAAKKMIKAIEKVIKAVELMEEAPVAVSIRPKALKSRRWGEERKIRPKMPIRSHSWGAVLNDCLAEVK